MNVLGQAVLDITESDWAVLDIHESDWVSGSGYN